MWLASAELAVAVCRAGAFGVLSPYAGMEPGGDPVENLRRQIRRTRTSVPANFGVNVPLDLPESGLIIDLLLREQVPVAVTAAGDPKLYTELLKTAGMRVAHVVGSVSQARRAESCGVDLLIAEGMEAGGRISRNETPLVSLIPQIRDAVSIPLVAAGGIAEGRGLAAAFALGADGVQLGTRFVASEECIAHPNYKRAIIEAGDSDTIVTRRASIPTRSLKLGFARELFSLEKSGAPAEVIAEFIGRGRSRKAQLEGDLDEGDAYAGSSVGLIKEILPVGEIVEELARAWKKAAW